MHDILCPRDEKDKRYQELTKLIYKRLLDSYGRRGCKPVTLKGRSFPTYDGGPRTIKGALKSLSYAVLTQNTAWKNVEKAIIELNRAALIDVDRLLAVRKPRLALLIRSSGYFFNQKAIKLSCGLFSKHNLISELEKPTLKNCANFSLR